MNRPPKKKKATEATPDNNPHAKAPEDSPLNQDDRNLVNIDQAFQEADVEDKVWLFWQRNKGFLIGASVLALGGVLAIQGYKFYSAKADQALQAEYQEADSEQTYESFGQANAGKPLGAFALLQAADDSYKAGDYSKATSLYNEAASGLAGTPFAGRALLGSGIALIKSGDAEAGSAKLNQLASNATTLDTIRAEAAFNLALLALENDDPAGANDWLKKIDALPSATIWAQQAEALINNTPELEALAAPKPTGESTIKVQSASEALPETVAVQPDDQSNEEASITDIPETDGAEDAE